MDDRQVGRLRVKNGILQVKNGDRWVVARRYSPEELMWRVLVEMDNRIKSLEYTVNSLRGHHD